MNGLPGSYTGMDKFSLGGSFSTQLDHCCCQKDGVSTIFGEVQTDILRVRTKRTIGGKTSAVQKPDNLHVTYILNQTLVN